MKGHLPSALIIGACLLLPATLLANPAGGATSPPWSMLTIQLFGGLSLFLYGMERLGEGLKTMAGSRMRSILGALSNNRFMGLLTGAAVTAVIQSSSVTTVMLVGFVSANLMSLSQSVGVILGADIGTTITAQIVAFKVTKYALLLVSVGFFILFVSKNEQRKQVGYMIMGLGLIFFGMSVMSDAMRPLRTYEPFIELMKNMANPVQGILIAAAFTGLIQSSSATMGVVIVLAMQGMISLEGGIALALGANIGTCVTAALAAIGKPREAVRVAVAHVGFKVLGVIAVLPFIPQLADLVVALSPAGDPSLTGQALLAATVPRQVANAHTLFNCALAAVFIPFTGPYARMIVRLVPDRPMATEDKIIEAKHLNAILLATPALAIDAARREIARLGRLVVKSFSIALTAAIEGDAEELERVRRTDDAVDDLYRRIVTYLGDITRGKLANDEMAEVVQLMAVANDLESIGDLVETDLMSLGERRLAEQIKISDTTNENLTVLHAIVLGAVNSAVVAVSEKNVETGADVVELKGQITEIVENLERYHAERLIAHEPGRIEAYSVEMDIIDKLRRVYYHAKRIAKTLT